MSLLRNILFALLALLSLCLGATEVRGYSESIADVNDGSYLPEFPSISRSIIGRADAQSTEELQNNVPASTNSLQPGNSQLYSFPLSALQGAKSTATPLVPQSVDYVKTIEHTDLRKRADNEVVYYFSLSVCSQPTSGNSSDTPPQLRVVISEDNSNADGTSNNDKNFVAENGYTSFKDNTSDPIFVRVQAPTAAGFTGSYTYELVVSIDGFYTSYMDDTMMYFVDTDNTGATFVSGNLTQPLQNGSLDNSSVQTWTKIGPQFSIYVVEDGDPRFNGLSHSYCAVRNTTQLISATSNQTNILVETGVTTFSGPALQQQFYVSGLQNNTSYLAAMGLPSNYSSSGPGNPGGGGTLYNQVAFTTKLDGACQLIYNLSFCPQINYAVPSNATKFPNTTSLANWYNNTIASNYQFFQYALDQIACDTPSDSQYSLAVTCDDCSRAYKDWICTVMSPRCHDYSSQKDYLHARSVGQYFLNGTLGNATSDPQFNPANQSMKAFNYSRNPLIDIEVMPAPYKELLPCGDICNKLVRSCPAALGFGCPYNPQNYNNSYGYERMDEDNLPMCNYPGKLAGVNAGFTVRPSAVMLLVVSVAVIGFG